MADDMGLGKTIQALCMLQNEKEKNSAGIVEQKESFAPIAIGDAQDDLPNEELVEIETGNKQELTIQGSLFEQKGTVSKPAKKNSSKSSNQNRPSSFVNRTSLIVVPTSLVYNWQNEALKFSKLNVHIHLGQVRRKDINYFKLFDVVITSYGTNIISVTA